MKKQLDVVILSDLHLGTYHCHANELLRYLCSIETKNLILNGDILDTWHFKKRFFPKKHMEVLQLILQMSLQGTKVYYITGNHDDVLRRFTDLSIGKISLRDKLVLQLKGERYWIFHGDIFDQQRLVSPLLYFFGKKGYDLILWLNRWSDRMSKGVDRDRKSLAEKIKRSFRKARYYIASFENKAMELAAKQSYDYVVCGHIHQPVIKTKSVNGRKITYMNSGDWVENMTALEYRHEQWTLYQYDEMDFTLANPKLSVPQSEMMTTRDLLAEILEEGGEDVVL